MHNSNLKISWMLTLRLLIPDFVSTRILSLKHNTFDHHPINTFSYKKSRLLKYSRYTVMQEISERLMKRQEDKEELLGPAMYVIIVFDGWSSRKMESYRCGSGCQSDHAQ